MPIQTYATGTVSVSDGSDVVTGTGGIWSGTNVKAGDTIYIDNRLPGIEVYEVTDSSHLLLPLEWDGGDLTSVPYTIVQNFPSRVVGVEAAKDVSKLVAALNKEGLYWFVGPDELEPDPSRGDEGQYARQPSTGKEWLKTGGLWVYQGTSGNITFDSAAWSSATTYGQRVIVSRAGRLWLSLQASNTNHVPESSPLWWTEFMKGGDAYDVVMFDTDRPASAELVLKLVFTKTVTFYFGLTDSRARSEVAATASSVYSFRKNGTQFATLTFGIASATGVFASTADAVFTPGDVLTIIAPSPRDATLSGVGATLSGYRN